jgi:hypothetical protein
LSLLAKRKAMSSTNLAADKYSFSGALTRLIAHSLMVVSVVSVEGAVRQIRDYKKRFEATPEKIHHKYFADILRQYKSEIQGGYESDSWLLSNNVEIVFGSEHANGSRKGVIPLSAIYQAALECRKQAKNPSEASVIYPEIFMLHLYRIFADICRQDYSEECKQLNDNAEWIQKVIAILEEDLSGNSASGNATKSNGIASNDPSEMIESILNDPSMDAVIKMVTGGLMQSGMFPDDAKEQFKGIDMKEQMRNMLTNQGMLNVFDMMNKKLSDAQSPEEVMKTGMSFMTNPTVLQDIMAAGGASQQDIQEVVPKMVHSNVSEELTEVMKETIVNNISKNEIQ